MLEDFDEQEKPIVEAMFAQIDRKDRGRVDRRDWYAAIRESADVSVGTHGNQF